MMKFGPCTLRRLLLFVLYSTVLVGVIHWNILAEHQSPNHQVLTQPNRTTKKVAHGTHGKNPHPGNNIDTRFTDKEKHLQHNLKAKESVLKNKAVTPKTTKLVVNNKKGKILKAVNPSSKKGISPEVQKNPKKQNISPKVGITNIVKYKNTSQKQAPEGGTKETISSKIGVLNSIKNQSKKKNIPKIVPTPDPKTYYRKQDHIVNRFTYKYVLKPANNLCSQNNTSFIILVHSKCEYADRRAAIRRTWGSLRNSLQIEPKWPPDKPLLKGYTLIFVTALNRNKTWNEVLKRESESYMDILQGGFIDNYANMTLKSLLGLKYVSENCLTVPYLVKSDDDMFLHIPDLIQILFFPKKPNPPRSIIGPYNGHSVVHRAGKWKLKQQDFPFDYFPGYESGAMYVISTDIVKELYNTSHYVKWIFIDDVYITGILAKIIGAKHVTEYRTRFAAFSSKKTQDCEVIKNERKKASYTNCTPRCMTSIWKKMETNFNCDVGGIKLAKKNNSAH